MVRLFVIVLRFLVVLLVARLVFRAVAALVRPSTAVPPRPPAEMVRDRVCNTFLPRERAIRAVVEGREEHFCSAGCHDRALAAAVSRAS